MQVASIVKEMEKLIREKRKIDDRLDILQNKINNNIIEQADRNCPVKRGKDCSANCKKKKHNIECLIHQKLKGESL